ncbi:MAG: sodium-translocating pyrophosphatase [Phycisphaeraceae bacterium]|nr:sodium-translocating pyrophosphatase [Phycisphaeraceae bacterium]
MASSVLAQEDAVETAAAGAGLPGLFWIAPIGAVAALVMAFVFYKGFMATSEGDENMAKIAKAVREGAYAYLGRQAKVVYAVVAVLAIVLAIMGQTGLQEEMTFVGVIVASVLSGFCGFLGMKTATNASARTANAAKNSLNDGLKVAFRAGAVMGLCVTGFALADVSVWFIVLSKWKGLGDPTALSSITTLTLSFAMGASLQALFARVGGGIYTKAADVGADLVGKVEAGIPEDDARNPATIADNVGDNVGDVAGMGADLYESYYGSILAAMALAAAAAIQLNMDAAHAVKLIIAAPCLAGLGILCSIFSIFCVRAKENASFAQLLKSLHMGVWISSALIIAGSFFILKQLVGDIAEVSAMGVWGAIISGLVGGLVIAWGTELYTSYEHKPTQRIAEQAKMGPATVIISGIAEGMISTWIPLITVVVAIMCAFTFAGGNQHFLLGVFGVGIAAVGMLSTLGITLATDAYGPIADNAGGNAEMTHQPPHVRERTDMLDSLGNTTAATGKGFAIGSAALTALALLAAYVTTVQAQMINIYADNPAAYGGFNPGEATIKELMTYLNITLMNPMVLCGLFIGVMLVMVFCAMTMNAVGRAAFAMIDECRRQFGIMKGGFKANGMSDDDIADPMKWPMEVNVDGKSYPDYANCVAISTGGALKEMVIPSLLAVIVPIAVGLVLGVPGVMGLLAGTLVAGFAMAIFMANAGGAWDNAKKWIETGQFGGKGSDAHKAGVVGDTVGDPFKDTSGPSLNILIKLVSVVSVVFAGLIVKFSPVIMGAIGLADKMTDK